MDNEPETCLKVAGPRTCMELLGGGRGRGRGMGEERRKWTNYRRAVDQTPPHSLSLLYLAQVCHSTAAVLVPCQARDEGQALVLGSDKLTLCGAAKHGHMIIT